MKDKYYTWTSASLLLLALGAFGALIQNALVVGAAIIFSYLFFRQGVKTARLKGKTDTSKIVHSLTENLTEFLGIASAVFFIQAWPVVFALAATGFREAFSQQLQRKLHSSESELLGRMERVIVLGLVFVVAYFNEYALVYGLVLVGSMALIETGRQLFFLVKT